MIRLTIDGKVANVFEDAENESLISSLKHQIIDEPLAIDLNWVPLKNETIEYLLKNLTNPIKIQLTVYIESESCIFSVKCLGFPSLKNGRFEFISIEDDVFIIVRKIVFGAIPFL